MEYFDLLAFNSGAFLRVQVKSAHLCPARRSTYNYCIGKRPIVTRSHQIDIYAFVALERRAVCFKPAEMIKAQKHSIKSDFFDDPNLEANSWQQSLDVIFKE